MELKDIAPVTSQDEARQVAIDWQNHASNQELSYGEFAEWGAYFTALANQFDLVEEFTENGIV